MNAYELIEASAGTGKTQALGARLIELMRAGVKPQEIVALTFSRAAAGEIFERFVSLLAKDAANHPGDAKLLREVIATQHLSQIGTLDSFLMRIVRAFPLELGLAGEIEMMDDYAAATERSRVSFSILRRTDQALKRTFVEAFSLAMNREDVRSFAESYRDFIKAWHERVAALPDESAWGDPKAIWERDPAFAHVAEGELAVAADRLESMLGGDNAWHAFAEWVRSFRGSFSGVKGIAKKLLESDETFAGDVLSFKFNCREYSLSREETLAVRDSLFCVCGYVVRSKLELARGIYRMTEAFEREYDAKVRRAGRLVFSDVPRLILSLPDAVRLSLEYRMDSRIRAWALDEFQDTSRVQWQALENLIDEARQSQGEKSVFIVGDTKQAIYGWRDGDVGIFRHERDSGLYTNGSLPKTYRSGPAVVEAVNRVFAGGRIMDEFPAWSSPMHESARSGLSGFVRVADAPGRDKEDFVSPVCTAIAAVLGEKESDPRRRGVSAAILVRSNSLGELMAANLKASGFEGIVWEGESAILDTPALSGFLDLVQLADHPGDALTYRHFALTPLAAAKYPDGLPDAASISCEMARSFTMRGLVRTFRELRGLLPGDPDAAWSRFTEERFTDMLRAAAEFELSANAGTRLSDFGTFLSAKKKRNVAEEGKIRIMTIHRSKGLGFDYVILPLYERQSLCADPSGPLEGDRWILPDPGSKVAKIVGGLEEAYRLRKDRAEQEALCMYYVAMTRAKRAMTIILSPSGSTLKFSDIVRSADLSGLENPGVVLSDAASAGAASSETAIAEPLPPPARGKRTQVARRLPSLQFQTGMPAGMIFSRRNARKAAMERGSALHAEMEKVEFSDLLPKPEGFVELWREKPFEVFADGEWISGRFDRVVFFMTPEGLAADIVDFKSSVAHPEWYAGQLAAYSKAVEALTGIPQSRISARLVKVG